MSMTHFDEHGNARMVDVGAKKATDRAATAAGSIIMSAEAFAAVQNGRISKGDVLTVATAAGIMGAKQTANLIPMCHLVPLTHVAITWEMDAKRLRICCRCTAKCSGQTGVEMEALTGVSTALLTVYDMCKAIDKEMKIEAVYLAEKNGGKSGHLISKYEEATAKPKIR